RFVVRDEVRPAEEARLARLIHLVETRRAAARVWPAGVRSDFAPVKVTGLFVDRDAKWIAAAHHVNLRTRPGPSRRETASFRDRISAVRLRVDAIDFAAEVVRIGGR